MSGISTDLLCKQRKNFVLVFLLLFVFIVIIFFPLFFFLLSAVVFWFVMFITQTWYLQANSVIVQISVNNTSTIQLVLLNYSTTENRNAPSEQINNRICHLIHQQTLNIKVSGIE